MVLKVPLIPLEYFLKYFNKGFLILLIDQIYDAYGNVYPKVFGMMTYFILCQLLPIRLFNKHIGRLIPFKIIF